MEGFTNKEQLEAYQEDLNRSNEDFIPKLSEEDQKKFEAISQASQILVEAQVPCYFFPFFKHHPDFPESCVQFNTLSQCTRFWNNSGMLNLSEMQDYMGSMVGIFITLLHNTTKEIKDIPASQAFPYILQVISQLVIHDQKRFLAFKNENTNGI